MLFIGYDIGSSSIKCALLDGTTNQALAITSSPDRELDIQSPEAGWAEQDPDMWWQHVIEATKKTLTKAGKDGRDVSAIGISYQMHGLVVVDEDLKALRPSIIWCDSRAIGAGDELADKLGTDYCFKHMLNCPGNFTASKLKWVKEHEPAVYASMHKFMLPGDYIAMKMTGQVNTTISGLSEGTLWDFENHSPAKDVLDAMEGSPSMIPDLTPTFGDQGRLTKDAAELLSLPAGTPIGYRAGDQPNNALTLGALEPGDVAATGGTSGVVYAIQGRPASDSKNRVNGFAHVNHSKEDPRIGVLLCINGAGIQYRWVRDLMAADHMDYPEMEAAAADVSIGSDGLVIVPYGNGAERIMQNNDQGAHIGHINFNRHTKPHFYRAALEGIAFSFIYGMEILLEMGQPITKLRVGNDNLFQSKIFSETIATLANAPIEMVSSTGAVGAARGAAYGTGHFKSLQEAVSGDDVVKTYTPATDETHYRQAYSNWKSYLQDIYHSK